jgi:hypothetical protein
LNDVLRDRDAYILFYAKDDPEGMRKVAVENNLTGDGLLTSSPSTNLLNGDEGVNGDSVGKKRSLNGNAEPSSPSKRRRLSSEEDMDPLGIVKSTPPRERPKFPSPDTSNNQTKSITYGKSAFTTINGNQSLSHNSAQQPYTDKVLPLRPQVDKPAPKPINYPQVIRGAETRFMKTIHADTSQPIRPTQSDPIRNITKLNAPQHRMQPLKRRDLQLGTNNDEDSFVAGYISAQHRHSQNRPRVGALFPGIQPSFIGETKSFMSNVGGKSSTEVKRNTLGIKVPRKESMRP